MRVRGATTELTEAGLETDGMAESTAKLREEILALSGVDIMIDDSTFKSTYQIMDELAQKWPELSDIAQASITNLIAGTRQGNVVSSLMENFDIARDALKASLGSEGSAMAEHSKALESISVKMNQLDAAWQSLSNTIMNSDLVKGAIDVGTGLLSGLDWLFNTDTKAIVSTGAIGTATVAIKSLA